MTAKRVSPQQRFRMRNLAEVEIMRYAGDFGLWHKHVHNVDLDPAQILKMTQMAQHANTIDFSCRRTGKTFTKEMFLLWWLATRPDQELGIVAPREAQSLVNLGYHLEAIRRSEILTAYINHKSGRKQLADTYYQFANRSVARAYGIMAQVDGGDLTVASLEEVDDMPRDRLFSRFLLMLGGTRRAGAANDDADPPQIRITGVFKGADTLTDLVAGGHYQVLFTVDVHLGIKMGILHESFMVDMRSQLAPEEYMRQLLCLNVSARNLVWEKYVRRALQTGLAAGIDIAAPLPGKTHKKRGMISFGYDAGGHGEDVNASRHALVVTEQIGGHVCVIHARTWSARADDGQVRRDLQSAWRYFRPDYALGDAYGVGMITQLNDDLYAEGLTTVDRRSVGEGESSASTWPEWPFSPLRFEGMTKHQMATAVRALFHGLHAAIPPLPEVEPGFKEEEPELADMRLLVRQIPNIVPEANQTSYASYKMKNPKLGDDLFDALMASVWGHVTRGLSETPTVILTRSQPRADLTGAAPIRLPSDPVSMMVPR